MGDSCMTMAPGEKQGSHRDDDDERFSRTGTHRRTGGGDLRDGTRGRRVCVARRSQNAGPTAGSGIGVDSFRHEAALREACGQRASQTSRQALAVVRQEDSAFDSRRHSARQTRRRFAAGVRLASLPAGRTFAAVDRHSLGGFAGQAADQAIPTSSRASVHVPGSTGCAFRQQPWRAFDTSGGDNSQEQLLQPQPASNTANG